MNSQGGEFGVNSQDFNVKSRDDFTLNSRGDFGESSRDDFTVNPRMILM